MSDFAKTIAEAYAVEGAAIDLGRGVHEGEPAPDAIVRLPLRMMNRHGLIAGATGTGKTIALQTIAEQLSAAGVAVFGADVKGDVSGLAGRRGSTPAEDARRISRRRRKEGATATTGGADVLGDFLGSREGRALGRKLARGVFGMLRKRL